MAVNARAHAGVDGGDITTSIEEVAALQFPFGRFPSVTYQGVGKDDVRRGGLVEVLIIDIEVDAQFLRRKYPYIAFVRMCEQSRL